MDIRFNFKVMLSLLFLFSGNAAVAMETFVKENPSDPVEEVVVKKTAGEELLESVDRFIDSLDIKLKEALEDNKEALEDNKEALEDNKEALEDNNEALEDNHHAITPASVEAVLDTQDFITLAQDATEDKDAIKEEIEFNALGLEDAIKAHKKANNKLKAKINTLNRAIAHPSRFVDFLAYSKLYNNACEAVLKLEKARMIMVKHLRDLAEKIDTTKVSVENDENRTTELNAKKGVLVGAIKHQADNIEKSVNRRIEALRPSTRFTVWARAKTYETRAFVAEHKWPFIGGAIVTVVTTGVLAYLMRDRLAALSFRKLPLINVFFGRKSAGAPVSGLNPVVIQPRPTV